MDKKALMFSLIILMIPVLYTISAVTATYDPSGRYSFVKGCEFGHADYWATFENQASDLNLGWARIPLKWKDAIYNSPPYSLKLDSPEYEKFILGVTKAKSMGLKVIVTIKDVPDVFKDPGLAGFTSTPMSWPNECGRISETRIVTRTPDTGIDYLGKFIVDVLNSLNYQLQPEYIELWNEPDVMAYRSKAPALYGCWAKLPPTETQQAVFATVMVDAGIYYAKVLNTVVAYKESTLPSSSVRFAGPAAAGAQSEFLDAVLTSIPTSNLDVLTYHQYVDGYDYSCNISEALGIQKTAFAHVRSDLNSRGGTAVPIFISEGAMKYRHWETVTMTPQPLFFQCQATFAPSLLQWLDTKKGSGDNAKGFIWYTIGGNYWAFTDLIYPNGVKKPVYYSWKDWGQSLWAPMSVRNYNFPISQGRGMDDFGQSEQTGAYPPPLDDSAPGIDQPLDQNNQVPYPAPDLAENTAQGAGPSLDQNNQFPYPAPDLVEDAIPTEEPTLDQNTPLPPPTPSPVETPTPGVDPTTEQATPTPSLTPAP